MTGQSSVDLGLTGPLMGTRAGVMRVVCAVREKAVGS